MAIEKVLAGVAVGDFDSARDWYGRLLGRTTRSQGGGDKGDRQPDLGITIRPRGAAAVPLGTLCCVVHTFYPHRSRVGVGCVHYLVDRAATYPVPKKEWFLGKGVKRWILMRKDVVAVAVVGAVDAVAAETTAGSAGAVNAVAAAVDGVAAVR
jgi:hypothetical protein